MEPHPFRCAPARRRDVARPLPAAVAFLVQAASRTVVTCTAWRMADAGFRRVVPSDLYPLVLGFLRDNQLTEVANKFAKATGAVSLGLGTRGPGWGDHEGPGPDTLGLS